jgi:signal transduction protein with GAF and PtsI domain
MKNSLSAAPPRLQRVLLQLQKYNVTVHHVSGKDIPVNDCLSRQSLAETSPTSIEGLDLHVHAVKQHLFVTVRRLKIVQSAIKCDAQMLKVKTGYY